MFAYGSTLVYKKWNLTTESTMNSKFEENKAKWTIRTYVDSCLKKLLHLGRNDKQSKQLSRMNTLDIYRMIKTGCVDP